MIYHINWSPQIRMNGAGFSIELTEDFSQLFKDSSLDEKTCRNIIKNMNDIWFAGHKYDTTLYKEYDIRFQYDSEWCIRSLTIPGNGCGLDLGDSITTRSGSKILLPHNIDSIRQASLLLTIVLKFIDYVIVEDYHNQITDNK